MILCLVDLDICDKVLSPCQTEAFLTVQSLFIHLFFFSYIFPACNLQQCQTVFWVEENLQDLSSGISFHHLSVEDEEDDLRTWCQTCYTSCWISNSAVRLALELYTPGWCSLCMLLASRFARWSSNMCEYMHPGDFPSTTWGLASLSEKYSTNTTIIL